MSQDKKHNVTQSVSNSLYLLILLFAVTWPAFTQAGGLKYVAKPDTPPLDLLLIKASSTSSDIYHSAPNGQSRPKTVWDRIRSHGNFYFDPDNNRIRAERKRYTRLPGYLLKVTQRAEPYLHYIIEELDKANLPLELALLPIVESAYDVDAHSKHGALGLWQFIPKTAKAYGLKKTWWYEGRQDLQASTRAAIRYFSDLRDMFDGDWLLVLAAYNAGENNVKRAVERNRKRGKGTSFWDLKLPKETMAYVPRFLSVLSIIETPEEYDIELWPVADTPYFLPIDAGGKVHLTKLAHEYAVDPKILRNLNAGFRRAVTPPKKRHTILLPVATSSRLADSGNDGFLRAAFQPHSGIEHTVRSGDTLSMLSRRYGVSVKKIKRNNELRNDHLHIGQTLVIPET